MCVVALLLCLLLVSDLALMCQKRLSGTVACGISRCTPSRVTCTLSSDGKEPGELENLSIHSRSTPGSSQPSSATHPISQSSQWRPAWREVLSVSRTSSCARPIDRRDGRDCHDGGMDVENPRRQTQLADPRVSHRRGRPSAPDHGAARSPGHLGARHGSPQLQRAHDRPQDQGPVAARRPPGQQPALQDGHPLVGHGPLGLRA